MSNNIINILPPLISEKIAAGEVVDRPFSVIKELLENSIDADAKNVIIEIKNGGKTYIRVTDNGIGIKADQVERAFSRHGTSKISNLNDLDAIQTLGFRGEALTSIGAVSRLEMITKEESEGVGTRLLIEGGEIIERTPVGSDTGTTVIIRDLFFNVPARLKFLKSDSAESSMIIDFLSRMALAYPEVSFRVINNQKLLFATDGRGRLYDNLLKIYENHVVDSLLKIDNREDGYEIYGYISPPHINRPTRTSQINFVNGRSVKDKLMEEAIRTAYKERLEPGRFPYTFLFLKVPAENLDVNIHPNKLEIRHTYENKLKEFLSESLTDVLETDESFPSISLETEDKNVEISRETNETTEEVDIRQLLSTKRHQEKVQETNEINEIGAYMEKPSFTFSELKPIGSVFATYIIAISPEKMYLIDQHAAHERVVYERFLKQYHAEEKLTQILLQALLLELTPKGANSFEMWNKELAAMGFIIEEFGGRTILIKGIPAFMDLTEAENFVRFYSEDGLRETYDKIIARACKAAIKANNILNYDDMVNLLAELDSIENPYSCPHGRPTILSLTKNEIERLFKRT